MLRISQGPCQLTNPAPILSTTTLSIHMQANPMHLTTDQSLPMQTNPTPHLSSQPDSSLTNVQSNQPTEQPTTSQRTHTMTTRTQSGIRKLQVTQRTPWLSHGM